MDYGLRASTGCFHYFDSGERCCALCLEPADFCCATHLHGYLHAPLGDLLRSAASAIADCTRFTESGLPYLACTRLTRWRSLCNALRALSYRGYHEEGELLTALVSSLEALDPPTPRSGIFRKGKPFERLVTRIYLEELGFATQAHARDDADSVRVLWNREMPSLAGGKRQIDVLLQRQRGAAISHTIVECRDHEVEVSEMDAFATLIRRVQADQGVMVSSVGFQSGARQSAALEGIEIRVVEEGDFAPEIVEKVVDPIYELEVIANRLDSTKDGSPVSRRRVLEHRILVMQRGLITGNLADLISAGIKSHAPALGSMPPHIEIPTPGVRLLFPDRRARDIRAIQAVLRVVAGHRRCRLIVPRHPVSFLIQGSAGPCRRLAAADLPFFSPPAFVARRFYVNLMGQCYFCEEVDSYADDARLILLKDRQRRDGPVLDIEFRVGLDQAGRYFPVQDVSAVELFEKDLARFNGFGRRD